MTWQTLDNVTTLADLTKAIMSNSLSTSKQTNFVKLAMIPTVKISGKWFYLDLGIRFEWWTIFGVIHFRLYLVLLPDILFRQETMWFLPSSKGINYALTKVIIHKSRGEVSLLKMCFSLLKIHYKIFKIF